MGANREIKVSLIGDAASLERALEQGSRSLGKIEKHTNLAAKAAVGFVAFKGAEKAAEFLQDATKAAAADEVAMSRAGLAVKNAGENWEKLEKPLDKTLTKMSEQSGFLKSDLVSAFSKAETATGNHAKALHNLHLAEEISLQTGKPLVVVMQAVNKESMGSANALSRYGVKALDVGTHVDALKAKYETLAQAQKGKLTPAQKEAEHAALDGAKALDKIQNAAATAASADTKYSGAITAHSKTMAGQIAIFGAKWEAIKVRIGDVILPLLVQGLGILMHAFDDLSTFVDQNKTLVEILGGALAVVTGLLIIHEAAVKAVEIAQKAWTVVTEAATAAQWLLNAALDGNPIVLTVIAIAALVAALVILYEKSNTARTIINTAFGDIKTVGKDVIGWFTDTGLPDLKTAWGVASSAVKLAIDPIIEEVKGIYTTFKGAYDLIDALIHGDWGKAWDAAKTMATGVFEAIDGAMGGLPGKLGGKALELVKGAASDIGTGIKNSIGGALEGLGGGIVATIEAAINSMIGAANSGINLVVDAEKKIPFSPDLGIAHDPIPKLKLAAGGIVKARPGGTVALLGEGGRDEAVIPLGKGAMAAGVNIEHIDMRNTGGSPMAFQRALSWRIRLASAGA